VGFADVKIELNLVIQMSKVNDAGGYVDKAWCLTYKMTNTKRITGRIWTCGMMIEVGFDLH
jgi:hypothetical protein